MRPTIVRSAPRSYCLITPCRNEAKYASRTIESVARQSVPPARWIIVDDGSTDETPEILETCARRLPYVKVIRRADRGFRRVGGGVIDAFNEGLSAIDLNDFEFICKLDLDLDLPPTYFESLIRRMDEDPRLGTCSGKPFYRLNGQQHDEVCGDENSVGMTKFYRRDCFEQIGGFVSEVMWDGIDCHRCRMLGWKAASFSDPELRFEHLRPMGSSQMSVWHGRMRHGEGQYFMGTGPAFIVASAFYRLGSRPRIVGSLAMLWGYLSAAMRGVPRFQDDEFVQFLRRYQWRSLWRGKRQTVGEIDALSEAAWLRRHHSRLTATNLGAETERVWAEDRDTVAIQGPHQHVSTDAVPSADSVQFRAE
jgi:glycosyltransferase involved in cell wall biosynthesis